MSMQKWFTKKFWARNQPSRPAQKDPFRKNYMLIFVFTIVLTISMVVALLLAHHLTVNKIESEFSSRKSEVLDYNVQSFNQFFQNSIAEVSDYTGFMDSVVAASHARNVLEKFPFVESIVFYDLLITNRIPTTQYGFEANNMLIYPAGIFQFERDPNTEEGSIIGSRKQYRNLPISDDFNNMAVKFASFIERADTTRTIDATEQFKVFYTVSPGRIAHLTIPRKEDVKAFKDLMYNPPRDSTFYQQDLMAYSINPNLLTQINTVPELYERIEVQPIMFQKLDVAFDALTSEAPLPAALSDYKFYFYSSRNFLNIEVNKRFLPIGGGILVIYLFLVTIAYLIYRNLNINSRVFKLQYDFINNLTHEFKTPVSVIKIAGNNIAQAKSLSDQERSMYGKILDQEADRLNNLMNTLLSFTQIENKSIQIKWEWVDLQEFCAKIKEAISIKYPDLRLECQVKINKEHKTDPVLLQSIFMNLIDNAYKYSPPDRRHLIITIKPIKKLVWFSFTDQGIGIDSKEIQNVFKKFYRLQNQYNQQGSIGLGLAFCKELVNFMGGEMDAESILGKGTTFHVKFPLE
jgi:two-component system phosphate regulon sensor histidine kinase PhoR